VDREQDSRRGGVLRGRVAGDRGERVVSVPPCPFCGAYSPRSCELEEDTGGFCPWEEIEDELSDDEIELGISGYYEDGSPY
jgi:hypothetical protein